MQWAPRRVYNTILNNKGNLMKEVKAKLVEVIKRTESIMSFRFLLAEKIDFLPGQFLEVIFDENNRSNKELNKYLSLSCSPGKNYIEATKRISDSHFCQRLKGLKKGDQVVLKLPLGACVYRDEYKNITFLIGGIGITPVISILEYIVEKKLDTEVNLFYSNRSEEDIAFKKELDRWQAENQRIKVYYTVTECRPKDSGCIFGRIDKLLLSQKACDLNQRVVYIFGPPKMVEAMYNLTLELSCNKENVMTEKFLGY